MADVNDLTDIVTLGGGYYMPVAGYFGKEYEERIVSSHYHCELTSTNMLYAASLLRDPTASVPREYAYTSTRIPTARRRLAYAPLRQSQSRSAAR